MFRRKDPSRKGQVDKAVAKAVSYEITVADLARRSERRAWQVAGAAVLMSLALAGGYYYVLPLKEKVPFLVMADAYTGTATVARLSGTLGMARVGRNEAVNRSNVAQYVLARESYDAAVMGLRDWNLVFTMSSSGVAATHRQRYAATNPNNPIAVYGKERAIRVRILSLTPLGVGADGSFKGASVRIQRTLLDKRTGVQRLLDNQIVTLRFTYRGDLALSEHDRVLNPLGFQVTEYRVDTDYARGVPADGNVPAGDGHETEDVLMPPSGAGNEAAAGIAQPADLASTDPTPATALTVNP